jgi:hypothetical protein
VANAALASEKLIVDVGFVVISLKNLITPSDASRATAAYLRCPDTDTEPEAATEVTLVAVLAKVKVVVVGTVVM